MHLFFLSYWLLFYLLGRWWRGWLDLRQLSFFLGGSQKPLRPAFWRFKNKMAYILEPAWLALSWGFRSDLFLSVFNLLSYVFHFLSVCCGGACCVFKHTPNRHVIISGWRWLPCFLKLGFIELRQSQTLAHAASGNQRGC